jgi:hypothetical protein
MMARHGINHTLDVLTGKIHQALMRKTAHRIALGGLFIEAKKQVGHGKWLGYIEENFSLASSTVESYIKIYQGAAKIPNFGNLRIASSLLDKLFVWSKKRAFGPEVRAAIFEEAKTKWVGWDRAHQIEREMQRAEDAAFAAKIESIEQGETGEMPPWEQAETERHPPGDAASADLLPPAVSISPMRVGDSQSDARMTFRLAQFLDAIDKLKKVMTRPAKEFAGVASENDLRKIIDFLTTISECPPAASDKTADGNGS